MITNTPKTMAMRVTDKNRDVVAAIIPHAEIPEGETYFLVINLCEIDWVGRNDGEAPALPRLILTHKLYRKPMFKSVFRFVKKESTNSFAEIEKPRKLRSPERVGTRITYDRTMPPWRRTNYRRHVPDIIA